MVAYVAGISVLAAVTPVLYTATLTVGNCMPLTHHRHHPVLGDQLAFDTVVLPDNSNDHVMPPSEPITPPTLTSTQPRSFLVNLFHLFAFTDAVVYTSFQVAPESTVSEASCSGMCSKRKLSSESRPFPCCSVEVAETGQDVSSCQWSVAKRFRNISCHHAADENQPKMFSDRFSVDKASPLPALSSPLSDAHNTSLLFKLDHLPNWFKSQFALA